MLPSVVTSVLTHFWKEYNEGARLASRGSELHSFGATMEKTFSLITPSVTPASSSDFSGHVGLSVF